MKNKHFGIEVEFTGVTREEIIKVISMFFRRPFSSEEITLNDGTSYIKYKIKDDNGFEWIIKRDRSIRAEVIDYIEETTYNTLSEIEGLDYADDYKCELVSPVLTSESVDTLLSLIDIIKAQGGMVNNTCGIHVHIDKPETAEDAVGLARKFTAIQDFIMKDFNVEGYRVQKYCQLYSQEFIEKLNAEEFNTIDEFSNFIQDELGDGFLPRSTHNPSRYYALNFHALRMHNTVEFRFFNSTLDKKEILRILNWVLHFCYNPEDCDQYLTQLGL